MMINSFRFLFLFLSDGAEAGQPVHDLIMLEQEKQKTSLVTLKAGVARVLNDLKMLS